MLTQLNVDNKEEVRVFNNLLKQQISHHNNIGRGLFEHAYDEEAIKSCGKRLIEDKNRGDISILMYQEVNELIGMCVYHIINNWVEGKSIAFIDELVIDKEYRDSGAGTQLFKEFENILKEENIDGIQLNCYTSNKEAIRFYEDKMNMTATSIVYDKKLL